MAAIEKPQLGTVSMDYVTAIGGRLLILDAHIDALNSALDRANALIVAHETTIAQHATCGAHPAPDDN